MDRNIPTALSPAPVTVALRKESVDRNLFVLRFLPLVCVALRKESVDRNVNLRVLDGSKSSSLSARRAWIEICVDAKIAADRLRSLSARRAWIEIPRLITLLKVFLSRSPQGERG